MDVDGILRELNAAQVDYILIGGMNFFLVHSPVATFDVDIFVEDSEPNIEKLHQALRALDAEVSFSPKGDDWHAVRDETNARWLRRSAVHCLNTRLGPLDVFRAVEGLVGGYELVQSTCPIRRTDAGVPFKSLSNEWMIRCQLALPDGLRKRTG